MDRADPSEQDRPARLVVEAVSVEAGGHPILRDVSMTVPAGAVVGLVGANGAGKTTLLDAICGAAALSSGALQFDGAPLRPAPHRLRELGIGRTTQGLALPSGELVLEHVMAGAAPPVRTGFGALLRALPRSEREADEQLLHHVPQLLHELGLGREADTELQALSHAQRARVAVARAAVGNPRLLLLDEPAAELDEAARADLADLIRAFAHRPGRDCSVVVVEHHADVIERACDAVVRLEDGRIVPGGE